jgi:hypothetical protein
MMRAMAPRLGSAVSCGSGAPAATAAVPRLPAYSGFRRLHALPAAAVATSHAWQNDALSRQAMLGQR